MLQIRSAMLLQCDCCYQGYGTLYFFPRVILYNFFSFLLIYGGLGFGVLFWVFGVGSFS